LRSSLNILTTRRNQNVNNFELLLQSTEYVKRITSEIEVNPTIYLKAENQKALVVVACEFYHSSGDPKTVIINIFDGTDYYFVYNGLQSGGSSNAIHLYANGIMAAYPLILLPNTTAKKYIKIGYQVQGLNGEDEDSTIRAVLYELQGYLPK